MPLYEYQCQACGHRFEKIQKFSDPPETICPVCGGAVEKLLSSPAIQFKGTGWYITDYARAGKGADGTAGKADTSAKGDAKGGESKGGESKGGAAAGATGGDAGGGTTAASKPAPAAPAKPD